MMGKGALARKVRAKLIKTLLVSLLLFCCTTFFVYHFIQNDMEAIGFPILLGCLITGVSLIVGVIFLLKGVASYLEFRQYIQAEESNASPNIDEQLASISPNDVFRIAGRMYYRNKLFLTKNWLIVETFWNLNVYSASSIMWAFLQTEGMELKGSFASPMSKVIFRAIDCGFSLPGDENSIYGLLHALKKAYPWIITEYTLALEKQWQNERDTFIKQAKEKMKEIGYSEIVQ